MPRKHQASDEIGGPGASHENRREPHKSKPHGEIDREDTESGNRAKRKQRPPSEPEPPETDIFASRADAGAGAGRQPVPPGEKRGVSRAGHTAGKDEPHKPKSRRQVR